MITNEQIHASRQIAGRVTRWHTWPMIRKPTVAEHSARVATLYVELWGMPRAEVLYHCLIHDMGEQTAGDVPYGAKRLVPDLGTAVNEAETKGMMRLGINPPELSDEEFRRFKVCDLLEMYETACVEARMGNQYALPAVESCIWAVCTLVATVQADFDRVQAWFDLNPCSDLTKEPSHG